MHSCLPSCNLPKTYPIEQLQKFGFSKITEISKDITPVLLTEILLSNKKVNSNKLYCMPKKEFER